MSDKIKFLLETMREQQFEIEENRKQQRIITRSGRFRERWEQSFSIAPEDVAITIKADGDTTPSEAWGEFSYNGKDYHIQFRRDGLQMGIFMNEERIGSVTGGNKEGNTRTMLEKVGGSHVQNPPVTGKGE